MRLLDLLEGGKIPPPGLLGAPDGLEHAVRATAESLVRGLRRFDLLGARALRRSITAARVCEAAVAELGLAYENAGLLGQVHNIGELWLLRMLEGAAPGARLDEVIEVVNRYQAAAGGQVAAAWKLPRDVVLACRDLGGNSGASAVPLRLARIATELSPAVEALADGARPLWGAENLAALGVSAAGARAIVEHAARSVAARE